ncbi:MAG: hypothetical protein RML73_00980 [Anaerolineae bacterium]|nr:hypothetical protein [Anaerolineae bacterium]
MIDPRLRRLRQALQTEGWRIWPALVNPHDHLELNHYPRLRYRPVYDDAHQWGEDVDARLDSIPYAALRTHPLTDQLFIGGLKNLLCGATTVVQHGPLHRPLFAHDYPVRVVRRCAQAHSLHFSTPDEIRRAKRRTPHGGRFYIHLAEGTSARARAEYDQLLSLGCVDERTVIIHGVGLSPAQAQDARQRGVVLVSCPSTNAFLLKAYADLTPWGEAWCLGSDSRLTADGDLLDEAHHLRDQGFYDGDWPALLSERPRRLLGLLPTANDWLVLPPHVTLPRRTDLALVVREGRALFGLPELLRRASVSPELVQLDGQLRALCPQLARRLKACTLSLEGLSFV